MRPLDFNIKVMKILVLWPEKDINSKFFLKHFLFMFSLLINPYFMLVGAIRQLHHFEDIVILLDHIIGLGSVFASVYMSECFIRNLDKIQSIVDEISEIGKEFHAEDIVKSTEIRLRKYSKVILLYGILGNLCYALFPLLTRANCERDTEIQRERDPCGLVVRVWYPFAISHPPLFHTVFLLELYICTAVSIIVLAITMVLVGMLMYAVDLFEDCGRKIEESCMFGNSQEKIKKVRFCIRYHIAIIRYSEKTAEAFSSMMLMHITLTSFEISVLVLEILIVDRQTDSARFAMHLAGWLVLLFLICYYGQRLIDESSIIAWKAYSTNWYDSPISVQKELQFLILRSQKPVCLLAASLGVMSLETYLGVLSTAYSYFTLLLNFNDD